MIILLFKKVILNDFFSENYASYLRKLTPIQMEFYRISTKYFYNNVFLFFLLLYLYFWVNILKLVRNKRLNLRHLCKLT